MARLDLRINREAALGERAVPDLVIAFALALQSAPGVAQQPF
jgi:hypothetical protein